MEHHHLSSDFNYAMLMNPWMVEVFSVADFIEIDVTFKVSPGKLVESRKPCLCRGGCGAKKRCSCRQLGQPCLPWCHPAVENCCNEGVASQADPVVDIDNVRDVKSITPWVIIW